MKQIELLPRVIKTGTFVSSVLCVCSLLSSQQNTSASCLESGLNARCMQERARSHSATHRAVHKCKGESIRKMLGLRRGKGRGSIYMRTACTNMLPYTAIHDSNTRPITPPPSPPLFLAHGFFHPFRRKIPTATREGESERERESARLCACEKAYNALT